MAKVGDPAKVKEAREAYDGGTKAITKTLTRWKPDYLEAEPLFQKAGRAFKAAGLLDSALDAWKKAAHCSEKMNNFKQAALTLEAASREYSVIPGNGGKEKASELLVQASDYYVLVNDPVRAADLRLRGGKAVETFNSDKAAKLYDEAANLFNDDPDKDVYALDSLRKVLQHQLALGKHASAMKTIDRLNKIYRRLNQPHNIFKMILTRVILLLAAADPITAQREYERNLDVNGFAASQEAACAEDMLIAYTEMDSSTLKLVVERNTFGFLDHSITKLARGLPNAIMTGSQVGVAHADEAATKAVPHLIGPVATGPGGLRAFGAGSVIGGAGNAAKADSDEAEDEEVVREREKDSAARAALFARPGEPATGALPPAEPPQADSENEEYDLDAALAGAGISNHAEEGNPFDDGEHVNPELGPDDNPANQGRDQPPAGEADLGIL